MEYENREKKGKGIVLILIIVFAVLGLLFYFMGLRGILQIIKWFLIIMVILGILGVLFYFVWYFFFKKHKYDVTYMNKQKLMDACHKGYSKTLKGLYLSGDKGHSRVYWGKITGYCRISVLTKNLLFNEEGKPVMVKDEKTGKDVQDYTLERQEQDVFSVSHKGWLLGLFEEDDVVRVSPDSHNDLCADIDLYGFSLLNLSEYWYLNNDLLDVRKIDFAILKEAERSVMFEQQRDFKDIVDKASGLDTGHQKRIEEKSSYEIPVHQDK